MNSTRPVITVQETGFLEIFKLLYEDSYMALDLSKPRRHLHRLHVPRCSPPWRSSGARTLYPGYRPPVSSKYYKKTVMCLSTCRDHSGPRDPQDDTYDIVKPIYTQAESKSCHTTEGIKDFTRSQLMDIKWRVKNTAKSHRTGSCRANVSSHIFSTQRTKLAVELSTRRTTLALCASRKHTVSTYSYFTTR